MGVKKPGISQLWLASLSNWSWLSGSDLLWLGAQQVERIQLGTGFGIRIPDAVDVFGWTSRDGYEAKCLGKELCS